MSHIFEPLTESIRTGCPPTDLKARTGEFTPPGIRFLHEEKNEKFRPLQLKSDPFSIKALTFNLILIRNESTDLGCVESFLGFLKSEAFLLLVDGD